MHHNSYTNGDSLGQALTKLESYPIKIVCISASLTILSYLAGAIVVFFLHPLLSVFYLILAGSSLVVSMKFRCINCYYFGKYCNFGLGKLASYLFHKGEPSEFTDPKKVGITAILSFGTLFLPVLIGLILLLSNLSISALALLIGYILIGIAPNFLIRGRLCEMCMQSQLGCPSYDRMMNTRNQ